MATIATAQSGYDASILHDPVDYAPDGPIAKVKALLEKKLKLSLKDERIVEGSFSAFDKFGNMVLNDVEESFREEKRSMGMLIVPLDYVTKIEMEKSQ